MGVTSFGAVGQMKRWTKRAVVFAGVLLSLASARDAAADCPGGGTAQTIPAGTPTQILINTMAAATNPCTLTLTGNYTAPPGGGFTIQTGITLRASGAPGSASLTVEPSQFSVISIWPIANSCPSGATVEGLTLAGGSTGIFVGTNAQHPGCPLTAGQVSGITLRNLTVTPTGANGNGIGFTAVQNSVIDSVLVLPSGVTSANGIILASGSNNNIVMNSGIAGSYSQMAIALQGSSDNAIVGNTINVATSFDGIFMDIGSLRNRIERNTIAGHTTDGILVNNNSNFNYVGLNTARSNSYVPGSSNAPTNISGTGIWVNNNSNANYLLGNDVSGSPENGMDILTSKSTFLAGNSVHGNWQGGIWVANVYLSAPPSAPAPQDTVLHGNRTFFNSHAGQIALQGASNSQAAFNYLSGAQGGIVASTGTVAFGIRESATASIFENTVSEVGSRAFIQDDLNTGPASTNLMFFRNRFLKGTNIANPPQTDGKNGITYSLLPAQVQWDGGSFLGGNHWSEHAASGNPDPSHPYTAFIGNTNGAPYVDRFPFQSETLVMASIPNSVTVVEPVAGSVLAAGTRKTVRWIGRGCSFVNISYGSPAGSAAIANGYPNTGYYFWTVPGDTVRYDYSVQVVCADSNGVSLGVAGNSPAFGITTNDLVLLNPGRASRFANGGVVRVAWKASANVTGVNIFVKSGSGAEVQVPGTVPAGTTFKDITLPAGVSDSSRVTVRIQNAAFTSSQDSVDGYFMVRGTAPGFTSSFAGQNLQVGSIQLLDWHGRSDSYTVDLDLVGSTTTSIAKNLTDFGTFTWLVPDLATSSAVIRATFKDANGTALVSVNSLAFAVVRGSAVPPPPPPPSNTNVAPARRDFDADGRSDLTVFRPSTGTWFTRYSANGYNVANATATQWGLPGDIPISGDFDGDHKVDLTVYRPSTGTWFIRFSTQGYAVGGAQALQWGLPGDIPVAADFDGDGKTELTVFRPSNGTWYIRFSTQGYSVGGAQGLQWGIPGDVPLAGDFDGDGKTDLTVFRPSDGNWFIRLSSQGFSVATAAQFQWGLIGDVPLIGDFDGDGRSDLTVFRPSTGTWYIRLSSQSFAVGTAAAFQWGLPGDVPAQSDIDGDGRNDIVVFRPANGTWYVRYSSLGFAGTDAFQWGLPGDEILR
jgi:hypothetical protein